ncbi:uncharacterized protein [Venturia canescens]|uniref:uncharacterized protein n=1 Tax=Venturia canescens TaxID=32260 RepID=UPI001C9C49BF|nr:uncharacterized protein LOC122406980 [Venturia canescens]
MNSRLFDRVNKNRAKAASKRRRVRRAMANDDEKYENKDKHADENETQGRRISWRRGETVVPITPQMIRLAVKELHIRRVAVSSSLIANHLQKCYPITSDPEALKKELNDKLEDAVSVGLVVKCGPDAYCIPTLRHQANTRKTDFTRFWEKYQKRLLQIRPRSRAVTHTENREKKTKRPTERTE